MKTQNLFDTLNSLWNISALESEMLEIINAVEKDKQSNPVCINCAINEVISDNHCNCCGSKQIEKVNYGDYVQMDDRLESVHIWSKEKEEQNRGRWIPLKITKEIYEQEKAKGY